MSRRFALVLAALALAACFSPEIPDGQVPCGVNGECPDGFECRAMVGTCFHEGSGGQPDAAIVIDGTPPADVPIVPDATVFDSQQLDSTPPIDGPAVDGPPTGPINVVFMGNGGGTVTLNGTMCTGDCSPRFAIGTVVQITAQPSGNSAFNGWGGACTGLAGCQVTVDAAGKTVEATFAQITQQVQLQVVAMGPGMVTVIPQGATCGPGCFTFGKGTAVTLTPTPNAGFSFSGWTGAGCEVVGVMPCMFAINNSTTVTARFCDFQRVVDGVLGADTNAGTCVAPFKTVTKALMASKPDERVLVRPGLYLTGETFPLKVPDSVTVIGDEAGKGAGAAAVRLEGGGAVENEPALRATVVLGARSGLAGFLVVNPGTTADSHGVVITKVGGANGAVVRNNTVTMCGGDGIYADKGQAAVIAGNVVTNQDGASGTGIRITDTAAGAKLESNVVLSNSFGVEIDAPADLGGGSLGSAGNNTFSCNTTTDLLVSGPAAAPITVSAQDNAWDHTPPTEACTGGNDLCRQNAIVSTGGATLAPSACP